MSESSQDSGAEPFDAEKFARDTISALEFADDEAEVLEDRVLRLEEIITARWPRCWLLRRRLALELRASIARYPDELIPRGNFRGRRVQWASEQISIARKQREHRQDEARSQPEGQRK